MTENKGMMPEKPAAIIKNSLPATVGELVASDFRTAEVFERYGVDFCCGGGVSLDSLFSEGKIDKTAFYQEIREAMEKPVDTALDFASWELSFLMDYIVNVHHRYLKTQCEPILAYTEKIAVVHGGHHPELVAIDRIFREIVRDLQPHLSEEEEVLFPAIRKQGLALPTEVQASLGILQPEHQKIGDAIHEIRRLSRDYSVPADGCNTYLVAFRKLKEFEDDLHRHVHLENNILFPKALGI